VGIRPAPRIPRWRPAGTELYCGHVRACHLQADLGRNRRLVPTDARPVAVNIAKLPSVPRQILKDTSVFVP
jgi:hypothetical protein